MAPRKRVPLFEHVGRDLLVAEVERSGVTWQALAERMGRASARHTARDPFRAGRRLRDKVLRGTFDTGFFMQALYVLDVRALDLSRLFQNLSEGRVSVEAAGLGAD